MMHVSHTRKGNIMLFDQIKSSERRIVFEDRMNPVDSDVVVRVEGWEDDVEGTCVGITTTILVGASATIVSENTVTARSWDDMAPVEAADMSKADGLGA